ncbi:MAG: integration host factor subunit beta [Planctomycetota bacterium]|nr:integration host factor subunit beta [Planctomycetota bacterium]
MAVRIVQATLDSIIAALATEGRLELRDFGVFEVRITKARKARNLKTGAQVLVPEGRRVRFSAGKVMEERTANSTPPDVKKAVGPLVTDSHSQP